MVVEKIDRAPATEFRFVRQRELDFVPGIARRKNLSFANQSLNPQDCPFINVEISIDRVQGHYCHQRRIVRFDQISRIDQSAADSSRNR